MKFERIPTVKCSQVEINLAEIVYTHDEFIFSIILTTYKEFVKSIQFYDVYDGERLASIYVS